LFCTLDGGPLCDTYVRDMLKRTGAKAGITKRVHPHGLRHSYASALEMGRIAFDASFRRSRERELPAALRAALGCRCPA
jgi:integrase